MVTAKLYMLFLTASLVAAVPSPNPTGDINDEYGGFDPNGPSASASVPLATNPQNHFKSGANSYAQKQLLPGVPSFMGLFAAPAVMAIDAATAPAKVKGLANAFASRQRSLAETIQELDTHDPKTHTKQLGTFIPGFIDELVGAAKVMTDELSVYTDGYSTYVGDFLMGPFVKTVTNTMGTFLVQAVGSVEDIGENTVRSTLSMTLKAFSSTARQFNSDTSQLDAYIRVYDEKFVNQDKDAHNSQQN